MNMRNIRTKTKQKIKIFKSNRKNLRLNFEKEKMSAFN